MARGYNSPSIHLEEVQHFQPSQIFPQARRPQKPLLCLLFSRNCNHFRKRRSDKTGREAWVPYAVTSGHQKDRLKGDVSAVIMMIFREDYDDLMEDLLFKLLNLDAEKRISVDEAINHPFFDSVRKEHFPTVKKK